VALAVVVIAVMASDVSQRDSSSCCPDAYEQCSTAVIDAIVESSALVCG
jgi:hypothetical protein